MACARALAATAGFVQRESCSERYSSAYRRSCLQHGSARDTCPQCAQVAAFVRRMVAFQLIWSLWSLCLCSHKVTSFTQPTMKTRSAVTSLRSGATGELKDYSGAAGGLFGTYRIPASLFAGASAGAAFAMPIVLGEAATLGHAASVDSF